MEAKAIARTQTEVEKVVEAVAIKSEELGIRTLDVAGELLDEDKAKRSEFWAKDLQSVSQAAKNFVGMARQARGLDVAGAENAGRATILFLGKLERVSDADARPEKTVTELAPSEVRALPDPDDSMGF